MVVHRRSSRPPGGRPIRDGLTLSRCRDIISRHREKYEHAEAASVPTTIPRLPAGPGVRSLGEATPSDSPAVHHCQVACSLARLPARRRATRSTVTRNSERTQARRGATLTSTQTVDKVSHAELDDLGDRLNRTRCSQSVIMAGWWSTASPSPCALGNSSPSQWEHADACGPATTDCGSSRFAPLPERTPVSDLLSFSAIDG